MKRLLFVVVLLTGCASLPPVNDETAALCPICYDKSDMASVVRAMSQPEGEVKALRAFHSLYYSEACGILAPDSPVEVLGVTKVTDSDAAPAVAEIVTGGNVWYAPTNYLKAYWSCADLGSDFAIATCLRQHYRY